MSFFERPDLRAIQSADPAPITAVFSALKRDALGLAICLAAVACAYAANVAIGLHRAAPNHGEIVAPGLRAPLTVVRDRRDVPHVSAQNDHDLYFAEGYVQGSDQLFQLDLTRRYAYGRLAEVLGSKALALDEAQRGVDIDRIAARQLRALAPHDREAIMAFSDGVNAAAAAQPLPVEFRILLYRPAAWTPKDSLAVSVVASLALAEPWRDVVTRDAAWRQRGPRCFDALFPLSDARYDVTIEGARNAWPRRLPASDCDDFDVIARTQRHAIGSNAWAAGAKRTLTGRALIANDPHLDLTIPGIWYLVDLKSPSQHVAGATIPGVPGVVLGHNERLAWASTNADMTTASVFRAGRLARASWVAERFHVRFSQDLTAAYYRTSREFSIPDDNDRTAVNLVRWPIYAQTHSTVSTVLALDRAQSVGDALRILATYCGSPQNFVLADRTGAVAYHVAGLVPDDPAWGRYVHSARDLGASFAPLAFARLPARRPARDALLISANNKAYGAAYPYRLSAQSNRPTGPIASPNCCARGAVTTPRTSLECSSTRCRRSIGKSRMRSPGSRDRIPPKRAMRKSSGRSDDGTAATSRIRARPHWSTQFVLRYSKKTQPSARGCSNCATRIRRGLARRRSVLVRGAPVRIAGAPRLGGRRGHARRASARTDELRFSQRCVVPGIGGRVHDTLAGAGLRAGFSRGVGRG